MNSQGTTTEFSANVKTYPSLPFECVLFAPAALCLQGVIQCPLSNDTV